MDEPSRPEGLRREVAARFDVPAGSVRLVRAPYRVCPLGAHVDHQLGPTTAMTLDRGVLLAYAPSARPEVRAESLDFPGTVAFPLDAVPPMRPDDWGNFSRGAAAALGGRYRLDRGMVGVASGKLHGGGVSSSAAVGIALLLALEDVKRLRVAPRENIDLDRRIEDDYLGLRNGILDPEAVLLSRRVHLTAMDCRTAEHELIPPPAALPGFRILLAFSGLSRALLGTDYNFRVAECADAARTLSAAIADGHPRANGNGNGHAVLGDIGPEAYEACKGHLPGAPRGAFLLGGRSGPPGHRRLATGRPRRVRPVDDRLGRELDPQLRMRETPLVDLYELLAGSEGVHGARFSGAGFRVCCVALVDPEAVDAVAGRVKSSYASLHPDLAGLAAYFACETDDGAAIVEGTPPRGVDPLPRVTLPTRAPSIAIAGAWGYIGRKFLDAALARGLPTFVHDPGPMPADLDPSRFIRLEDNAEFYALDADLFHLALHPEHRRLDLLSRDEPLLILNEKPMALPDAPDDCDRIVATVDASLATVMYDFPELDDPLTFRLLDHLARFDRMQITGFEVQRSKDREDPANSRNAKRMVDIQYQESVHCLAFVLFVLASVRGSLPAAIAGGVRLSGESDPYEPPNPDAYPAPVNGHCRFRERFGDAAVEGLTDFKRGAPWTKRRVVRGLGDGRPFEVEISYLEGAKSFPGRRPGPAVRPGGEFIRPRPRDGLGLVAPARSRTPDERSVPQPAVCAGDVSAVLGALADLQGGAGGGGRFKGVGPAVRTLPDTPPRSSLTGA